MSVESRDIIRKGSKSFFFASLFFNAATKQACWDLYQWCRECDDRVDQACSPESSRAALALLKDHWLHSERSSRPVHQLRLKYQIPETYFLDLLHGMEMDVQGKKFQNLPELEHYAYHVAGVVGIKMSYIMGLSDPRALQYAEDLGKAMQLTNIARDVKEDFERGRVYLPLDLLKEAQVPVHSLCDSTEQEKVYGVVLKLLDRADELYASGDKGLVYLPLRAALAVSIAASVYSGIGKIIRKKGPASLQNRTVVSFPQKLFCALRAVIRILPLAVQRLWNPWTPNEIFQIKDVA